MKKLLIVATLATTLLATGCSNHEVVSKKGIKDSTLSCVAISKEVSDMQDLQSTASKDKGASGSNVAMALFFFPGAVVNYLNASDAVDAAQDRENYLVRMYSEKGCNQ